MWKRIKAFFKAINPLLSYKEEYGYKIMEKEDSDSPGLVEGIATGIIVDELLSSKSDDSYFSSDDYSDSGSDSSSSDSGFDFGGGDSGGGGAGGDW